VVVAVAVTPHPVTTVVVVKHPEDVIFAGISEQKT
jgi:hypothetical protein